MAGHTRTVIIGDVSPIDCDAQSTLCVMAMCCVTAAEFQHCDPPTIISSVHGFAAGSASARIHASTLYECLCEKNLINSKV